MKFSDEILEQIIKMGASGKTVDMIALDFNLTQNEFDEERAKNKRLDEALNIAQSNAERFAIAKLWSDCLNGKNTLISKDLFLKLTEKQNKHSDNKIEIEIV